MPTRYRGSQGGCKWHRDERHFWEKVGNHVTRTCRQLGLCRRTCDGRRGRTYHFVATLLHFTNRNRTRHDIFSSFRLASGTQLHREWTKKAHTALRVIASPENAYTTEVPFVLIHGAPIKLLDKDVDTSKTTVFPRDKCLFFSNSFTINKDTQALLEAAKGSK